MRVVMSAGSAPRQAARVNPLALRPSAEGVAQAHTATEVQRRNPDAQSARQPLTRPVGLAH
jgi:hypothetical protein